MSSLSLLGEHVYYYELFKNDDNEIEIIENRKVEFVVLNVDCTNIEHYDRIRTRTNVPKQIKNDYWRMAGP